jgi:hypothetical protein
MPIPLVPLDEGLRVLFPYPLLGRRSAIRAHERDNLALVAQQQIPQRLKGAQTAVLSAGTAPRMERPPIRSTYPDPSRDTRVHAVASAAHAMKNQWLMLLKREDLYQFRRDFPLILAREGAVLMHNLLFAPRALVAIPMTVKVLRETLRKRRAANSTRDMEPRELRRWLVG